MKTITTAAHEAQLTAGTLRTYERLGLLHPMRDSMGRRLFTDLDVQARRIAAERRAGQGRGLRGGRVEVAA